ncbi:COG1361 family protein [Legionella hackeliae]|nr:hypothetical protein [Legionella hackeliae]
MITTVFAGAPLWTFEPLTDTKIKVPANGTAIVQYRVTNQSRKTHTLTMQPMRGIRQITSGLNVCRNPFILRSKNSCILSLQINGSQLKRPITDGPVVCQQGNLNQCYRPSSTNILRITRGPVTDATISVNPSALNFVAGNNGMVTVTNTTGSPQPANNVVATIPGGSSISMQSTTCGASLAVGASCTITFTAPAAEGPTNIGISGSNTNTASVAVTVTSIPIATISVNPTTLLFAENSTGIVTVTNDVASLVPAENVVATIPGGSSISVQSTTCGASLAVGASCTITFTAPAAEGPTNIDISGSNTNTASVAVTVTSIPIATISVNPTTLLFAENSTGIVTVTNDVASLVPAENVVATIPGGSSISVQSTTCGASLAIGASCTITFASSIQEGPTTILITGDNTNTVSVDVMVTSQPQISITNPVQQNRVVTVSSITPLSLEITNDAGSVMNANAITVSNKADCPNLSFDDSNCTSVAPGGSCMLELTSNSPYAPCTITVSGNNTANSPTTLIAFSYLGGLVFQENAGSGKVVIDVAQGFISEWTAVPSNIAGATSLDDGFVNTNAIAVDAACLMQLLIVRP